MSRRSRSAFTIVELLVVIAVIAILIAVLVPALSGARAAGQKTVCLANIRSIAAGLTIYANDNDSELPHWSGWQTYEADTTTAPAPDDSPGPGWTELIKEDLEESLEVHRDPARPHDDTTEFAYFLSSRWVYHLTGQLYTSLRRDEVRMPSMFILTADCNQPGLFPEPYGTQARTPDCDKDDATQPCLFFDGCLDPHHGSSNICFLDGHAKAFTTFNASEMTYHPRKQRNWSLEDPVPTPGS